MIFKRFIKSVVKAKTEEEVISAYYKLLPDGWTRPFNTDGHREDSLFEFKYDEDLTGRALWKVVAQGCYYLRLFYKKGSWKKRQYSIPLRFAVCDVNEAAVFEVSALEEYFTSDDYDWKRAASSPCPLLVEALAANEELRTAIFRVQEESECSMFLEALSRGTDVVQSPLTVDNFRSVFTAWKDRFGAGLRPQEVVELFLADLQLDSVYSTATGELWLLGGKKKMRVAESEYRGFWTFYKRPPTAEAMRDILARKDQLVAMQTRREQGEFFTPLNIAEKAHEYILKQWPDAYEDYVWWDPCAGSGNLTYHCPSHTKLFISTLHQSDLDLIAASGQNPQATMFQFDFLNDPDSKIPAELVKALSGGKVIIIMNPPFAAGTDGIHEGAKKSGVSDTAVAKQMGKMGAGIQNLYTQFLWRVQNLFETYGTEGALATFSKALWLTGSNFSEFRGQWNLGSRGGFVFESKSFADAKGKWPCAFTMWAPNSDVAEVDLDVLDEKGDAAGASKVFRPAKNSMNKWVSRPKARALAIPLRTAVEPHDGGRARCASTAAGHIAYCRVHGNGVVDNNLTMLFSSTYHAGDGWSIVSSNISESLVTFAIRRSVKPTWLNDADNFSAPVTSHSIYPQFATDAVIYALFHNSNLTSSIVADYDGKTWDVRNEFFPLTRAEVKKLDKKYGLPMVLMQDSIKAPAFKTGAEPWAAQWLVANTASLSPLAKDVVTKGLDIFRMSFDGRLKALPKFQLLRYDAGWFQILVGMDLKKTDEYKEFRKAFKDLELDLREKVYILGCLPK